MASSERPGQSGGEVPRAIRLVFEYEGDDVTLVERHRLAKRPWPPHALVPREDERGYWVQLSDGEGRPLYRRIIHDPIQRTLEVVGGAPNESLTRIPVDEVRGRFSVVVPDIPAARSVALFGPAAEAETVTELHRAGLDDERRGD
jgi:hypothetical protein